MTLTSNFLANETSAIKQSLGSHTSRSYSQPTRNFATSSSGYIVALIPILTKSCVQKFCSLSSVMLRCAPLFESASSCISSTTTYSIIRRCSLNFGAFSTIAAVSGVVMSICGGFFSILCLSVCVVSPVLTAILMSMSMPSSLNICEISLKGSSRFFLMSFPSALRGLI